MIQINMEKRRQRSHTDSKVYCEIIPFFTFELARVRWPN